VVAQERGGGAAGLFERLPDGSEVERVRDVAIVVPHDRQVFRYLQAELSSRPEDRGGQHVVVREDRVWP
jgi:hypothetical protein